VILGIPRGGVVIGAVLAEELGLPLDVLLTKKLGHPRDPELAIGVADLDGAIVDEAAIRGQGVSREYIAAEIARVRALLMRRCQLYRGRRPPLPARGRTAIICDDGIATGRTITAAIRLARAEGAARIVAAVPVGPPQSVAALGELADATVCALQPEGFRSIGAFYRDFAPVEDAEAVRLLEQAAARFVRIRS
jgi:predicted phosphoribosyltransferase